jgi:hypothetical protein
MLKWEVRIEMGRLGERESEWERKMEEKIEKLNRKRECTKKEIMKERKNE